MCSLFKTEKEKDQEREFHPCSGSVSLREKERGSNKRERGAGTKDEQNGEQENGRRWRTGGDTGKVDYFNFFERKLVCVLIAHRQKREREKKKKERVREVKIVLFHGGQTEQQCT